MSVVEAATNKLSWTEKMQRFQNILTATSVLLLTACVSPNTLAVTAQQKAATQRQEQQVTTFLAEQTRDPEAARVRSLVGYTLSNGDRVICGEFNGKNAYGGYVGYDAFYVRLRENVVKASAWGASAYSAAQVCSDMKGGNAMIQPD
jgi:hypothetical protein